MTLYRQLIIFTFLLFFLLFAGTWFAKLDSTRTFLINQLESHAQDAATSLSLSISPYAQEQDSAAIEVMINAVFDRGYYQIIRFSDTRKKTIVERSLPVKIENVPAWFINLVPLKTPESTADVMAGWNQAGSIYVKSHPGYAYKSLWDDVVNMTVWFSICAMIVLIAGGLGLRLLLKPLVLIEQQADDLCKKKYSIQEPLPWTKEFRKVVEAMNRMTNKVKDMFTEQVAQAEALRERAYHDSLTGLGNRRYLESQLNARLEQRDSAVKGALLLIRIHDLDRINTERGFTAGDNLLKRVAELLKESIVQYPQSILARVTGGDFGVYSPDTSACEAELVAGNIAEKLCGLAGEDVAASPNIGHIGAAVFDTSNPMTRILAEADLALAAATRKGPNAWELRMITDTADVLPSGQQQWKEVLLNALESRSISLDAQPVIENGRERKTLHLELLTRIVLKDGSLLNAGIFMPLAERLHLVSAIDRLVIEEALKLDRERLGAGKIAINLSPSSLADDSFKTWVYAFLRDLPPAAPRVTFEFSEYAAVQHLAQLRDFSAVIREFGHGIGLDHYGQSFSRLGYLQSLRPDYVKIDRAYTGELRNEESDSRFYINSLCSVAHSIDVAVIAEGVETEQQLQLLSRSMVDAVQGYYVGMPEKLVTVSK